MLVPSATDPWRVVAPAAKRRASARLVLPAPPGPTSAMVLVPAALPGMIVSFVRPRGPRRRRGCASFGNVQPPLIGRKVQGGIAPLRRLPPCAPSLTSHAMTSTNDIRRGFLDYFGREGHAIVPSAP